MKLDQQNPRKIELDRWRNQEPIDFWRSRLTVRGQGLQGATRITFSDRNLVNLISGSIDSTRDDRMLFDVGTNRVRTPTRASFTIQTEFGEHRFLGRGLRNFDMSPAGRTFERKYSFEPTIRMGNPGGREHGVDQDNR